MPLVLSSARPWQLTRRAKSLASTPALTSGHTRFSRPPQRNSACRLSPRPCTELVGLVSYPGSVIIEGLLVRLHRGFRAVGPGRACEPHPGSRTRESNGLRTCDLDLGIATPLKVFFAH